MRSLFAFGRLAFPAFAFGVLVKVGAEPVVSAFLVVVLAFGEEISAALRTRRVAVEGPGFKGSIDGPPAAGPEEPGG